MTISKTKIGFGNIFQQFLLSDEELMAEVEAGKVPEGSLLPGERWTEVRNTLLERGFTLLLGQSSLGGVPANVLVGIPVEVLVLMPVKDHFYELTQKFNLPFQSGECFIEEPGLLSDK